MALDYPMSPMQATTDRVTTMTREQIISLPTGTILRHKSGKLYRLCVYSYGNDAPKFYVVQWNGTKEVGPVRYIRPEGLAVADAAVDA